MDDTIESKKTKPKCVLESMFQKKFKAMELSPALPIEAQKGDKEESSSSPSLNALQSHATEMESDSSSAGKNDGQLVTRDEIIIKTEYNACLSMSVHCLRFLLRQGLECCVQQNKWEWDLFNEGNFIELFKFVATYNENFRMALSEKALEYYQITSLEVQKNLIHACAKATTKKIVEDIGDDYFGILVDGSNDKLGEDQLSVYLRYVDKRGIVIERFLGIALVDDLTPESCKAAIDSLLVEHSLSPGKIRGQSYNGARASNLASNYSGDIHGLKTLIMKENPSAYYLHSFSHRLHLTVTTVAEKCSDIVCCLFMKLADLLSLVRVSCARNEMLDDVRAQKILEAFRACELESGRYSNQEYCLERSYDCWDYDHFKALLNVIAEFPMIIEVLEKVAEISSRMEYRSKADTLLDYLESFEFAFAAHLMIHILGYTDVLNRTLQTRDRALANFISLVPVTKLQFQKMRSNEKWELFMSKVSSFCEANGIEIPDMSANYAPFPRQVCTSITNYNHFRSNVYFEVIDQQLEELNNQFDEVNMELLTCMACLDPDKCFSSFDKQKLIRLAKFYPGEFSNIDLMTLGYQLDNFILDLRSNDRFKNLKGLGELAAKLVETRKHDVYVNVYLLLKLMLILLVTTPSIERTFSAMDYVKYKLQNNVGDQLLNDSLTTFVEREVISQVLDDDIVSSFKAMKTSQE